LGGGRPGMFRILVYVQWWWSKIQKPAWPWWGSPRSREAIGREEGQSTAEYALVMLAAAAIALVLLAWARSSGKLPAFFDRIIDQIVGNAD
jgi:fatty acid desaturase